MNALQRYQVAQRHLQEAMAANNAAVEALLHAIREDDDLRVEAYAHLFNISPKDARDMATGMPF